MFYSEGGKKSNIFFTLTLDQYTKIVTFKEKSLLQQMAGCLKASHQITKQAGCVQSAAVGHFGPSAEQNTQDMSR